MKIAAIQPPRLQTVAEGERTATWLELFYDLAFVAAVAMLGTRLVADASWTGWLSYLAYFALIWWLWASHTFYADRYDTDDLVYRLMAGAQMVGVAFIAASVTTGPSGSTVVFAMAYAAVRIILLLLYSRAYRYVPETRDLVRGYLWGFGAASVLWTASIFVPDPVRQWVWAAAFVVDLATPYVMRKAQAAAPLDVSHLPERFGLFTILVLGETIVAVTVGLGHVEWQWATSIAGICGLAIATSLWWIHFDNVDGFVVRRRGDKKNWRPTVWIYSHLPLAAGLAMIGVGVEHAIIASDHGHDYHLSERWVLVGGAIIALSAMAAIQTAALRDESEHTRMLIIRNRVVAIPIVIVIGLITAFGATATVVLLAIVCIAEVGADVVMSGTPDLEPSEPEHSESDDSEQADTETAEG
jgi:low temperature requirement protein LtrA